MNSSTLSEFVPLPQVVERVTCRSCGEMTSGPIVKLGPMHISQFPRKGAQPDHPKIPLELMRCHQCGLVQLTRTTPREWLYEGDYWYRSGVNESMVLALRDIVQSASRLVPVSDEDLVLDIGANDGTLLAQYHGAKRPFKVAVEPSYIGREIQERADVICEGYFPDVMSGRPASLFKHIHSIAMFYDLEDPGAFVAEIKKHLHPEGIWVCQFGDLLSMLETNGFDAICHEHLEYWSFSTFAYLVSRYGLKVIDCQRNAVNGGSLRLYVAHRDARIPIEPDAFGRIQEQAARERGLAVTNDALLQFKEEVDSGRKRFMMDVMLANLLAHRSVDLLGASTKASTLLQYYGLGPNGIRRAIERSPQKWGRTTVTGIPIVSESEGRRDAPAEVLLVGPWHFKDALIARERGKWAPGTKMVFPLPKLEVVTL